MSNLQITLAVLGVIIVLGVVIYNNWYSVSHAPRKASAQDEIADEAMPDVRKEPKEPFFQSSPTGEPALDNHHSKVPTAHSELKNIAPELDAAIQPEDRPFQPVEHGSSAAPQHEALGKSEVLPELDALVFSITQIQLDVPVSGDSAIAALPPTRRLGSKQLLIEGLNTQTKAWETPKTGSQYGEFQAGVQLANRLGALTEIEFSEFVHKAQAFADAIGGSPDFPDMLHEVARAREVDSFAAQNDAILSFVIVARRATWSPGYVRQMAAQYGFKHSVTPGRLTVPAANPANPPVLVLSYDPQAALANDLDHVPVHEIMLTLDVPTVERSENAFQRLRDAVEGLAESMDGVISDPDGRPLPAMTMDPIASDIDRLYEALDDRGLSAGSPAAQKLFS